MKVKPGYKQTEVGVIPDEWEVSRLADLMEFRNGINAEKHAYGKGIPFINVLDAITHTHIRASDIPGRIQLTREAIDSHLVRRGDIVFNRTSETQSEVGLSSVYVDDDEVVFGGFVIRGRPVGTTIDATYSGYGFRAPHIRSQIVARGQGVIRANIGQADLRQVLTALPPLHEQRAIAGALGDVEALIDALDRLIEKKRAIKRAATQQLITGQTRLHSPKGRSGHRRTDVGTIPEDWEVRPLLSAVHIVSGQVDPKIDPYRSMILVAPDHIESETGRLLQKRSASDQRAISGKYLFEPGDIVYCKIRPYLQKAFIATFRGLCSADMYPLTPADGTSPGFILAVLLGHRFSRFAKLVSVRSGIPKINREELAEFKVALPPPPEQRVIAAVLSDMDAEIEALEQRRDKTRALKQGMMQELLTGRTRLV